MIPPDEATRGLRTHRRETRLYLWLPLARAVLLTVLLALALILPQDELTGARAQAVASIALIVMCLLPGVVLALGLYAVMVASIVGMNRLHRMSIPPIQRVEKLAFEARQRVSAWSQRANQSAVRWGALMAPLDQVFIRIETVLKEASRDRSER